MKKYVSLSLLAISIIVLIFIAKAGSLSQDEKVTAFNNSLIFEKKAEYTKAINELVQIYEKNKDNYLFNMRLGWLYYIINDYPSSKKYYQIAVKIGKDNVESLLGLVYPLAALGEWTEVQVLYEKILKIDPQNYTANLRLGQIYLNSGSYTLARKYLETANSQYPAEYEPNLSLGWTCYYLGDTKRAKELLTNVLMLSPNDSLALQGLRIIK